MERSNKKPPLHSHVVLKKYEVGKFLGQGNFAKVYHAKNLETGQSVAIKVIDKEKVLKAGLTGQTETEISAMTKLKHPNIVELYEVMATKTKIYIVMEYAKGGELFDCLTKIGKLSEPAARKYFRQLIAAVEYCHTRGVFHRDLKPENLLLDEDGDLKVSDFGLSKVVAGISPGLLQTTCGTPAYAAPDVIFRGDYDGAKADVWSCGVILFVLLAGYLPFHGRTLTDLYKKIGKGKYSCPNWLYGEPKKLISKMLNPNPNKRITMAEIMNNTWFKKELPSHNYNSSPSNKRKREFEDGEEEEEEEEGLVVATRTKPSGSSNAFDIISLSAGLDLSGLFKSDRTAVRFASGSSAAQISAKFEEIAARLNNKRVRGKKGRKGSVSIEAEISEFAPSFHLVEVKKSSGDTLEYRTVMENDIRPGLKDIVWTWHGEKEDAVSDTTLVALNDGASVML